jgi:hypothetical protein
MPLGSLILEDPNIKREFTIDPISLEIRGKQIAAVSNSVVCLKYYQSFRTRMNGRLFVPIDNNICVHTIKFSCGRGEVVLECHESKKCKQVFTNAKEPACLVNPPKDAVFKVGLGQIDPRTEIVLSFEMTLVAASSSDHSIFFKFPLESCSPAGRTVTFDWTKSESFLFRHEITAFQKIKTVKSNLGGRWLQESSNSGIFELVKPTTNGSLILMTEFATPMAESLAIRFGEIVCGFIVPPLGSSTPVQQEYIFVLDCSGSMSGLRLTQAKECLQLYLHSLPPDGYFNVVRFGSRCDPMWQSSRAVTDGNIGQVVTVVSSMDGGGIT